MHTPNLCFRGPTFNVGAMKVRSYKLHITKSLPRDPLLLGIWTEELGLGGNSGGGEWWPEVVQRCGSPTTSADSGSTVGGGRRQVWVVGDDGAGGPGSFRGCGKARHPMFFLPFCMLQENLGVVLQDS
jgi:hypothetical protein